MKENSPTWARLAEMKSAGAPRMAEDAHRQEGDQGFADDDDAKYLRDMRRRLNQDLWVEQHADRDEEERPEGLLQGPRLLLRPMAVARGIDHDAGEEGAQGEGDAEQLGGADGYAEGRRQGRQGE